MKKLLVVAAMAVIGSIPASALASDSVDMKKSYIGIEVGQQTSELLENAESQCNGDCFEESSPSFAFMYGRNFNKHVAVEVSAQVSKYSADFYLNRTHYKSDIDAVSFIAGPKFQISPIDRINVFVKPGVAQTIISSSSGNDYSESSFGFMLSAGAEANITNSFAIRASWELIQTEIENTSNDMTSAKIGAIYRF